MIKHILAFVILIIAFSTNAQNTVSPYSVFGPGEIQRKGFGATQSFGGAGIALKSGNYLNNLNPASYTGIDSMRIIAEFGLESKLYNIKTNSSSQTGYTGNFNYFALGFRYTNWLAGSFGVVPFSSVGYSLTKQNYVEGVNSKYTSLYSGSGGITQFYFSNAIQISKNFSVGINTSYMFGPLIQEENILQSDYVPGIIVNRQDFLRSFYFDYGLQYSFVLKNTDFVLGATYSNKQNLKSRHILNVYDESYSVVRGEEYNTDYLTIPTIIGLGISISKNDKYNILFDYNFQKWAGVDYPNQYDDFINAHSLSLGVKLSPWEKRVINKAYKNWDYRFGLNYETSYLKFGTQTVRGGSVCFGAGIPLPGRISTFNVGVEIGTNGTISDRLVRENFVLFQLGFSLNEIAFIKRKFD